MSFEESQPICLLQVFEAPPDLTVFWHRPCYTVQPRDFQWDSSQGFVLASQLHSLWSSEDGWSPGVMYVLGRCPAGGQSDAPDPVLQLNAWGFVSDSFFMTLFLSSWTLHLVPDTLKHPQSSGEWLSSFLTIPNLVKSFTSVLSVVLGSLETSLICFSRVFFPEFLKSPTSCLRKACSVLCGSLWISWWF